VLAVQNNVLAVGVGSAAPVSSLNSGGFGLVPSFAAQARELSPAPGFVFEVERVCGSHARWLRI
jgi:hypothetical protein